MASKLQEEVKKTEVESSDNKTPSKDETCSQTGTVECLTYQYMF